MGDAPELADLQQSLYQAVADGRTQDVSTLLDSNPSLDVNWVHPDKGWSLLHQGVASGAVDALTVLLNKGANLAQRDGNNKTALHLATEDPDKHPSLLPLLVEHTFFMRSADQKKIKELQGEVERLNGEIDKYRANLPFPNRGTIGAPTAAVSKRNAEKAEDREPGSNGHGSGGGSSSTTTSSTPAKSSDTNSGTPRRSRPGMDRNDSTLRTPRMESGRIMQKKRRDQYEALAAIASKEWKNVTSNVLRQFRLLDDPPKPIYKIVDALCIIAGSATPPSNWGDIQRILAPSSFRESLRNAKPELFDYDTMKKLKKACFRMEENLNRHKLPPPPFILCRWITAFEQATNFCLQHPLDEKHVPPV